MVFESFIFKGVSYRDLFNVRNLFVFLGRFMKVASLLHECVQNVWYLYRICEYTGRSMSALYEHPYWNPGVGSFYYLNFITNSFHLVNIFLNQVPWKSLFCNIDPQFRMTQIFDNFSGQFNFCIFGENI